MQNKSTVIYLKQKYSNQHNYLVKINYFHMYDTQLVEHGLNQL